MTCRTAHVIAKSRGQVRDTERLWISFPISHFHHSEIPDPRDSFSVQWFKNEYFFQ